MPQHKTKCVFCDEKFIDKTFSKHLMSEHFDKLFDDKDTQKRMESATTVKDYMMRPIEIKTKSDDKSIYFVPCCKKFYMKNDMAKKHISDNPECKPSFRTNAKDISELIKTTIQVSKTISVSGDNNTIVYNDNSKPNIFIDLSGNNVQVESFKQVIRLLTVEVDHERRQRATYCKTAEKYKKRLKELNIDISDISEVESYYSDVSSGYESDTDKCVIHYDITKEEKLFVKKHNNIDLSRDALKLRTSKDKLEQKKNKEDEEKELKKEEKTQRNWDIATLKNNIKAYKDSIAGYKDREAEGKRYLANPEESGVTQDDYNRVYDQTKKIRELNEQIASAQSEINRLEKMD